MVFFESRANNLQLVYCGGELKRDHGRGQDLEFEQHMDGVAIY